MSLANPVRNRKLPLAIQKRLNEMYARDTGFSGPEILEFFSQYSLDIEPYPWQGGAPSRHQMLEDCLARFDVNQQKQLVRDLLAYDGRLKYGQPKQEDKDFIKAWLYGEGGGIKTLPLPQQMTVAAQPIPSKDVFLCHASSDKDTYVRPLSRELTARGVSFWLDEAEIVLGASITQKFNQGVGTSRYVLVFLSEAFLERNWPQAELSSALYREFSSGLVVVLPLMIADPEVVFQKYPLLRDKNYQEWSPGPAHIAERLRGLLE
jgi:hypothetical protein